MTQTPNTPAGWYPDAQNPGSQRYWDGAQWTDQVAPIVQVPTAPPATAPTNTRSTGRGCLRVIFFAVPAIIVLVVVIAIVSAAHDDAKRNQKASTPTLIDKLCTYAKTHPSALGLEATAGDGSHSFLVVRGAARDLLPKTAVIHGLETDVPPSRNGNAIALSIGDKFVNFVDASGDPSNDPPRAWKFDSCSPSGG